MSRYILRGTMGIGDEPNDENPLSHFGTDVRWEIGYDRKWFTFWARLWDEDSEGDDLTEDEEPTPIFVTGTIPYECPDVEMLNRELWRAMNMGLPAEILAAMREEQRRHLAGELGESRETVAQRLRMVRQVAFRHYLQDVQPLFRPRRAGHRDGQ